MADIRTTSKKVRLQKPVLDFLRIFFPGNALYWADGYTKLIEKANLDGSGRMTVSDQSSTQAHFFGLVLYQTTLYYTDWNTQ